MKDSEKEKEKKADGNNSKIMEKNRQSMYYHPE